jgi:hypothetical protein
VSPFAKKMWKKFFQSEEQKKVKKIAAAHKSAQQLHTALKKSLWRNIEVRGKKH